ncbi:F-type H+-transporting ATPase subunit gamma [Kribbella orskensis]|uniref:ATP synthase gamma chain n=1 Tax=Kribbella orskensis TaxID=2512216 RepID=A0ABY2BI12_9ACTN|nr:MULTISPECIES: F0F1 ATP synthase subunit gamma [Kribbella]TCN38341.1 F-type H+-transporting ATPase subunit gamma [Kribbella sp. VKM Ac-2500]TCO20129.1 F-type H+-transporting ATPase subunit gamma [Kribbella orskensis]
MPATLRQLRERRASVSTIKKLTRAMELIAASRIVKAQQRAQAAGPYARELTRAVSAVATFSNVDHPLTTENPNPKRAAVLLITSDRGQAGAYSSSVIREGERLNQLLREDEKEILPFLSGRKGIAYYTFRQREIAQSWSGDSDAPSFTRAREIADALIEAFLTPTEEGGVDEIHIVFTRFVSMLTQRPDVIRLLPLEVVEGEEAPEPDDVLPLYEFEPSAEDVLDGLLPKYVASRIHYCMLQAAASELASRQRAMKSATDNAQDLIERLTREANQARQAQITQEISEIVGGAGALADASAGSE